MVDLARSTDNSMSSTHDSYLGEKPEHEIVQRVQDVEQLEVDVGAEQKLIRKVDRHIILMVMLLYLFVSHQGTKVA